MWLKRLTWLMGVVVLMSSTNVAKKVVDKCTCGMSPRIHKRVVGGERAAINQYPWVAELRTSRTASFVDCGGALINRCYVLTAAHCFKWEPDREITVTLGTDQSAFNYAVTRKVIKEIRYPSYDRNHTHDDIMLLKLDHPVEYDSSIQPVCLPDPTRDYVGETVTVTGFGSTSYRGVVSKYLRILNMKVIPNEDCYKNFKHAGETNLCAGGEEGRDACQGDSGSPLTYEEDGVTAIVGIVSYGKKCALKDVPGVYTRISKYIDWIRNITAAEPGNCCPVSTLDERFV